jgi:hypothetical protein
MPLVVTIFLDIANWHHSSRRTRQKKVHTSFFFRKDVKILVVTLLQKTFLVAGKIGFQGRSVQPLKCHRQ